jgi:hypothetical protein
VRTRIDRFVEILASTQNSAPVPPASAPPPR